MQKERTKKSNFYVGVKQKALDSTFKLETVNEAYFPYQPYPEQIRIISTLHKSICQGQNCLIQSPTGTGKTLCLLSGCLSALKTLDRRDVKLFYLTRTHSQIEQVVSELSKTPYKVKLNIVASRDHLCVNPSLKELSGRALEKTCNDLVAQKSCIFKENQFKLKAAKNGQHLNLSQFKEACKKQMICPFFNSREATGKCEMTILPFNYFLDWRMFEQYSEQIMNSVIVFDEAHNVDNIAEEGTNLEINTVQIEFALNELKSLKKHFKFQSGVCQKQVQEISEVQSVLGRLKTSLQGHESRTFTSKNELEEFMSRSTCVVDEENPLDQIEGLCLGSEFQLYFQKFHGITKLFYRKEVSSTNFLNLLAELTKLCTLFKGAKFQQNFIINLSSNEKGAKALSLKCLTPSIAFKKIQQCKPLSIVLSSGTLGNLKKLQTYLRIPFKTQLTIKGFVTKRQLFASIISESQTGYRFQFNFQKKQNENQHREVYEELEKIEKVVPPKSGIVVAFSTYSLMQKIIPYCLKLNRKIYYETKRSDMAKVFKDYSKEAELNGAFLFIVMKGRFSEGINFEDYLCRCLVVIGIPFLPSREKSVEDKMRFLAQNFSKEDSDQWYKSQTFQAVNQTIGRVIRNKEDYGSIFLIDQRYAKPENFKYLSEWFKESVLDFDIEPRGSVYSNLDKFFKEEMWKKGKDINRKQFLGELEQTVSTKDQQFESHAFRKQLKFPTPIKKKLNQKRLLLKFDSTEKKQTDQPKEEQIEPIQPSSTDKKSNPIKLKNRKKQKRDQPSLESLFIEQKSLVPSRFQDFFLGEIQNPDHIEDFENKFDASTVKKTKQSGSQVEAQDAKEKRDFLERTVPIKESHKQEFDEKRYRKKQLLNKLYRFNRSNSQKID